MPWWVPVLTLILGWVLRYFYDLKIQPTIDRSHKDAEKKQIEQEDKEKQEREAIKRSWENDKQILLDLKSPIEELTSLSSFPDSYPPDNCVRLLRSIKPKAERIERPEFQHLRDNLRLFSSKLDKVYSTTLLHELKYIINGKYDHIGPQDLLNEIEAALKIIPE